MAWKIVRLHGWWVSFERDNEWHKKHKEVSGFWSVDKLM